MTRALSLAAAALLLLPHPGAAHRLDEYLVATMLSLDGGLVTGSMRLVPGVDVATSVIAAIDTDGDQALSAAERQDYARRVLADLALRVDDAPLPLRLVVARFPSLDEMKRGVGEIQLEFTAVLPRGGHKRRLVFENRHRNDIAVYLANCLVPRDDAIRITGQVRNGNQSAYELDFEQDAAVAPRSLAAQRK